MKIDFALLNNPYEMRSGVDKGSFAVPLYDQDSNPVSGQDVYNFGFNSYQGNN